MPLRISGERKSESILTRVTPSENDVLRAMAHLDGLTVNEFVRRLIASEIERRSSDPFVAADVANRQRYREAAAADVGGSP